MSATCPLTRRQRAILDFIRSHRIPPTIREIGDQFGIASPNGVRGHLHALERKGYIRRTPCQARSIVVIGQVDEIVRPNLRIAINADAQHVTITYGPPSSWDSGGVASFAVTPDGVLDRSAT